VGLLLLFFRSFAFFSLVIHAFINGSPYLVGLIVIIVVLLFVNGSLLRVPPKCIVRTDWSAAASSCTTALSTTPPSTTSCARYIVLRCCSKDTRRLLLLLLYASFLLQARRTSVGSATPTRTFSHGRRWTHVAARRKAGGSATEPGNVVPGSRRWLSRTATPKRHSPVRVGKLMV
jgi:hypothetical protein